MIKYSAKQTGINLRKYRNAAGLSVKDVCGTLHVTPQAISRWETGKTYPGLLFVCDLARLYGVTVELIMTSKEAGNEVL